jgi:hypothetical protein
MNYTCHGARRIMEGILLLPKVGMKTVFRIIIWASIFSLVLTTSRARDKGQTVQGTPSAFYQQGDRWQRDAASLVLLERADLRGIFATKAQIDDREKRRVAILDRRGEGREVTITTAETVGSFLRKCEMPDVWKSSWQPQIRLITESSLFQSPGYFDAASAERFLALPINPGDILIVTHQQ